MDFIYVYSATHPTRAGHIVRGPVKTDDEGYPVSRNVIIADKGKPEDIVNRAEQMVRLGSRVPEFSITAARSILEYYGRNLPAN
jgi:hypothetical protein